MNMSNLTKMNRRRGKGSVHVVRPKKKVRGSMNGNTVSLYKSPIEVKYYDTTVTQYATQGGTLTGLDYPSQGITSANRIGDSISVRSLECRYTANLTGASTRDTVRMVLLVDQQGFNTPVPADIIQPAGLGTAFAPLVPFNYVYRQRFKILHEDVFSLTTAFSTYTNRIILSLNFATTFVGASTFMNQIYWLILSDEGNPAQYPLINSAFRVSYTDQ